MEQIGIKAMEKDEKRMRCVLQQTARSYLVIENINSYAISSRNEYFFMKEELSTSHMHDRNFGLLLHVFS